MPVGRYLILLSLSISFIGCSSQKDGFAPSAPIALPSTSARDNFKYGQTITTSTGWEASLDTTDPTEEITLANGWTVEVMHE